MAPKKKEQQKMSLGDFLTDSGFGGGSWADEVEETYVTGTQPLPPSDRPRPLGSMSSWQERSYPIRDFGPQPIPDKPPYTVHLGNLSYDATMETVTEFFEGCDVASVRIIEDREMMRPKGFGYVEFANVDGLKKALDLDGQSFQGRMIKIKVADPPRGGDGRMDSSRDLTDWTRKGPLPDLPGQRSGGRQPPEFGDRRSREPAGEPRPQRELTWERRGPLSPLAQQESAPLSRDDSRPRPAPEGLGERSESYRGNRPGPAAWGEGRQEGSRPPRRDQPERVVTAAEKDTQWRDRMRPDAPAKSTPPSREGSEAPSSPSMPSAASATAPAVRPRLNLQKRTVSEAIEAVPTPGGGGGGDTKASPFGAARPIDTATKEKEIEEKRQQSIREKREADEKAKEERRLAKQAAVAKAEAEAQAQSAKELEEKAAAEIKADSAPAEKQNGEQDPTREKAPSQSQEPRDPKDQLPNYKSRATESGSWRSASTEQRANRGGPGGPRGGRGGGAPRGARVEGRGGRANGSPTQQAPAPLGDSPAESPKSPEDDGWTTVPNKKGRQGRPVAS